MAIASEAEADLRELMGIPANYKVLFLQGGGSAQFAMIPMNLLRGKKTADYLNTGEWSKKAISEAKKYCEVNVVASSADKNFSYAPTQDQWKLNPDAAYVHYCSNETIGGVEIFWTPDVGAVPLVADMSSHILSRPIDVSKYALIYAGAQKNIGPAGLAIIIVREDLIGETLPVTPSMYDYKIHADNESMYNTPPTFAIYVAGLVFKWLKAKGGLSAMEKTNIEKANLIYDYLDTTDFYGCPTAKENRSRMNIPFTLKNEALDEEFLKQAKARGLVQLKGHRSVGGMRASIYNAMPIEGVRVLVDFMKDFEKSNSQ
jgi:phosphoserine aminotransferase